MKSRQLRGFLEAFLASQGATTTRQGENLLDVRSPRRLVPAIGAKELVLAFNIDGLREDPHSELATVGNPVFDRILELARQAGRAGERFEAARPLPKKLPLPEEHFTLRGPRARFGPMVASYAPLYYFLFRIEYSLEEVADELEAVPMDSVSLQTLAQTPELVDYWEGLQPAPAPDRTVQPAYPVPAAAIRASLRILEKRLRKRLGRIRKESEEHLNHETDSIGNYYRQLIEETRNAGRRWALPASGREERIRLLQLDWKRRAEEAQQFWHPHVDVKLVAIASVQRPRLAFPILSGSAAPRQPKGRRAGGSGGRPQFVFWDEGDGLFIDPACAGCGSAGIVEFSLGEGGVLCPRCSRLVGGVRIDEADPDA
jgi:hypothetical protein